VYSDKSGIQISRVSQLADIILKLTSAQLPAINSSATFPIRKRWIFGIIGIGVLYLTIKIFKYRPFLIDHYLKAKLAVGSLLFLSMTKVLASLLIASY
jgi:hypothetical protein